MAELRRKLHSLGGRNFLAQYQQEPSRRTNGTYIRTMMKTMVRKRPFSPTLQG